MSQKTRTCIISSELRGPHRNGGVGTHCYYLSAFLSQQLGQEVTFLYTGPMESENESYWKEWFRRQLGIEFAWLPPPKDSGPVPPALWCYYVPIARRIYEWLGARQFDACHFQDQNGVGFRCFQAKRLGLAFRQTVLTCTVHSPWEWICQAMQSLPQAGFEEVQSKFMERYCVEHADVLISLNNYMLGWLERNQWKTPERKRILPNLFDPELRPVGHRPAADHLIFFGRLEVRKGLILFLETIRQMDRQGAFAGRQVKVTFLGRSGYTPDGGGLDTIQNFRPQLSPALELREVTDLAQPEALKFLAAHNDALVVCPSLIDNSPYAVIECLQLGLNIIAADCGGIPELFAGRDRLFAPERDALASKIQAGLNNELPAPHKRHDWSTTMALWREFCQETLPHLASLTSPAKPPEAPEVRVFAALDFSTPEACRTLESLRAQTWKSFSVTALRDGPNRGTTPVPDEVQKYFQPGGWNLLTAASWQDMVKSPGFAGSRYAVFLNRGCRPVPQLLQSLVQSLEASGLNALSCCGKVVDDSRTEHSYEPLGACLEAAVFRNLLGVGCVAVRLDQGENSLLNLQGLLQPGGVWAWLVKMSAVGRPWDVCPEALVTLQRSVTPLTCADLAHEEQLQLLSYCSKNHPIWLHRILVNSMASECKLWTPNSHPASNGEKPRSSARGRRTVFYKIRRETKRVVDQIRGLPRKLARRA